VGGIKRILMEDYQCPSRPILQDLNAPSFSAGSWLLRKNLLRMRMRILTAAACFCYDTNQFTAVFGGKFVRGSCSAVGVLFPLLSDDGGVTVEERSNGSEILQLRFSG
jgi:hypothetical protein